MIRKLTALNKANPTNTDGSDIDALLVARTRAGDEDAFEMLVSRYQVPLFGYLRAFVGDSEQARDLLQETFLKAYRSLGSLAEPAQLRGWLYRIAHNQACSLLRRRRLIQWMPLVFAQHATSPERNVVEAAQVEQALARVPLEQRAPLLLHLVAGFSYAEIATLLHVSEGAVRIRISRGRAAFRVAYSAEDDNAP